MNQEAEQTGSGEHEGRQSKLCAGGSQPKDRKYRCVVKLITFVISAIVAVLTVFTIIGLFYGTNANNLSSVTTYALVSDVILSYDHAFCQGIQAGSYATGIPHDQNANATLYLLKSSPLLTDRKHLSISVEDVSIGKDVVTDTHWNFHMNKGSNISFQLCYQSNDSTRYNVDFYLIKGQPNYAGWMNEPTSSKFALKIAHLKSECQTIQYQIQHDDNYYIALRLTPPYVYTSELYFDILLEANLAIYHISEDMIIQNCSFPLKLNSYCSITNKISPSSTAVLSLRIPDMDNYSGDDSADIQITCLPRVWLYVIIGLCCLIPILFITIVLITGAVFCVRKMFKEQNSVAYVQLNDEEGDDLLNAASDTAGDKPSLSFPA